MPGHWTKYADDFIRVFNAFCLQADWDKKCPIVDVGYGCLPIDNLLHRYAKKYISNPIVRVDPNKVFTVTLDVITTTKFAQMAPNPDFPTVHHMCHRFPELVGNCNVVLIWPWHNKSQWVSLMEDSNCGFGSPEFQHAGYDIEAIKLLLPRAFLTIYSDHDAGTPEFTKWLKSDSRRGYFLASEQTVIDDEGDCPETFHCELYIRH